MTRSFFNQKAATWDEACSEADSGKLKKMASRLEIKPGDTLLDLGTGTGVFLPFLLSKIGKRGMIVAFDYAEEMLKRARGKNFGERIYYLQGSAVNLPLRGEIFDACVCYSSFPHFRDKPKALLEMNRVIKKGGRILICHTSNRDEINRVHRQIPAVADDLIPAERELKPMLELAGFTDISIDNEANSYLAVARKRYRQ